MTNKNKIVINDVVWINATYHHEKCDKLNKKIKELQEKLSDEQAKSTKLENGKLLEEMNNYMNRNMQKMLDDNNEV